VAPHLYLFAWLHAGCFVYQQPPSYARRHVSGVGALAQVCLVVFLSSQAGCAVYVFSYRLINSIRPLYTATFGLTCDASTFRLLRSSQNLISPWFMVSSGLYRFFFFFLAAQPPRLISP
jgi:hypothetical protein